MSLVKQLLEADGSAAEKLRQKDQEIVQQYLSKLGPKLLLVPRPTPGQVQLKYDEQFPDTHFAEGESGRQLLSDWALVEGFKRIESLTYHSCNWREDCSEAGCQTDIGVVFYY
jgi:hypothetical protein